MQRKKCENYDDGCKSKTVHFQCEECGTRYCKKCAEKYGECMFCEPPRLLDI